jgi:hypothetical protein
MSWATRKWNYEFDLFGLQFHDYIGFNLFTIHTNLKDYSLLAIKFRLPNKANIKAFVINDWDILFMHNYLWQHYDDMIDDELWGMEFTWLNKTKLHFLNKLFK